MENLDGGRSDRLNKAGGAGIEIGDAVGRDLGYREGTDLRMAIGFAGFAPIVGWLDGVIDREEQDRLGGLRVERLQRRWYAATGVAPAEADRIIGPLRAAYAARAREPAPGVQDGGVVTALLASLLEQGHIRGAVVSHHPGPLRGRTVLAAMPESARRGAGSVYDQTYPLAALADGLPADIEKLALVGTPCQVARLRALQLFPWRYRATPVERVTLTVALFCTRSFDPVRLAVELARRGLDPGRVARVDVRGGYFRALDAAGQVIFEARSSALRRAALRGVTSAPTSPAYWPISRSVTSEAARGGRPC